MNGIWRKRQVFLLVVVVAALLVWYQHEPAQLYQKVTLTGKTMGTTYSIKYLDLSGTNYQESIDSLLQVFNQSLSTYIPDSEISRFNDSTYFRFQLPFFYPVVEKSQEVYEASAGAFDPTVGPLVNAWGFGPEARQELDSAQVDSLLEFIGFDKIYYDSAEIRKPEEVYLDFSAIAKGYGVDAVAEWLESKGITNYFVEIGGEIRCSGKNEKEEVWRVGINKPSHVPEKARQIQAVIELENRSVATSGNYRNYYEKGGVKYAHTISPFTGFPVSHTLLSATVVAEDCMTADAWATAFMVLGLERAKQITAQKGDLEVYLIYSGEDGEYQEYVSEGLKNYFEKVN